MNEGQDRLDSLVSDSFAANLCRREQLEHETCLSASPWWSTNNIPSRTFWPAVMYSSEVTFYWVQRYKFRSVNQPWKWEDQGSAVDTNATFLYDSKLENAGVMLVTSTKGKKKNHPIRWDLICLQDHIFSMENHACLFIQNHILHTLQMHDWGGRRVWAPERPGCTADPSPGEKKSEI